MERALDGKVIDSRGQPVEAADVWLFSDGGREARTATGDGGHFRIPLGGDDDPWPAGDYVLRVLAPGVTLDSERTLALPASGSPAPLVVEAPSSRDVSALAGWIFLLLLCALLVVVSWAYLDVHGVSLGKLRHRQAIGVVRTAALSEPLADALATARKRVQTVLAAQAAQVEGTQAEGAQAGGAGAPAAESQRAPTESADEGADEGGAASQGGGQPGAAGAAPAGAPAEPTEPAVADAGDDGGADAEEPAGEDAQGALLAAGLDDALATAEGIYQRVEQSRAGLLDDGRLMLLRGLFTQAEAALAADDAERLLAALETLEEQVQTTRSSFLWEENPGRLLEVMFWALLATLLRLIFNAGQYLYAGRFLKTAIPQHLAFLFTVPVVAAIIALVLMVVRIDAGGDTGVLLDMSNVLVSIILGALIGLAPWRAWEFLRALADRVFERLAGWARGGGDGGDGDGGDTEAV